MFRYCCPINKHWTTFHKGGMLISYIQSIDTVCKTDGRVVSRVWMPRQRIWALKHASTTWSAISCLVCRALETTWLYSLWHWRRAGVTTGRKWDENELRLVLVRIRIVTIHLWTRIPRLRSFLVCSLSPALSCLSRMLLVFFFHWISLSIYAKHLLLVYEVYFWRMRRLHGVS